MERGTNGERESSDREREKGRARDRQTERYGGISMPTVPTVPTSPAHHYLPPVTDRQTHRERDRERETERQRDRQTETDERQTERYGGIIMPTVPASKRVCHICLKALHVLLHTSVLSFCLNILKS